MDQEVMFIITRPGSNTTPLEGLISTVFLFFWGVMIWQRRRRNQPVDEGAFQEMWAVLPGTSKEKRHS